MTQRVGLVVFQPVRERGAHVPGLVPARAGDRRRPAVRATVGRGRAGIDAGCHVGTAEGDTDRAVVPAVHVRGTRRRAGGGFGRRLVHLHLELHGLPTRCRRPRCRAVRAGGVWAVYVLSWQPITVASDGSTVQSIDTSVRCHPEQSCGAGGALVRDNRDGAGPWRCRERYQERRRDRRREQSDFRSPADRHHLGAQRVWGGTPTLALGAARVESPPRRVHNFHSEGVRKPRSGAVAKRQHPAGGRQVGGAVRADAPGRRSCCCTQGRCRRRPRRRSRRWWR